MLIAQHIQKEQLMANSRPQKLKQNIQALLTLSIIFCLLLLALPAVSQTTEPAPTSNKFFTQKYLLGDWGGARTRLEEEKGVTFDFFYMGDFQYAANARIKDGGAGWNRVRGTMDIDFGKLVGPSMKNWGFRVTGLWQGGPNLGANYLGSISNPSTLVSARTEMLDSYWLQYAMLDGKVTLKAGQLASMDFYGLDPWIWHFMMEPLSYGFQNRFNDYASFDPASGPGVQLIVNPNRFMYYSVAYTSGNRDPYVQDPNGFHYVKHNSGVLSDAVGFKINQPGGKVTKEKYYTGWYEVGSTYNGGKFTDPFKPVPLSLSPDTGNYVFYFMGQQAIYRPKAGSNTGLDVVGGMSISPNTPYNFVDKNLLVGLVYNGPIPSRPNDSVNFGLSYTHVSDKYAAAYAFANPTAPLYSSEKAFEVNYSFQATPYWYIQPTAQWYTDVGGFSKAGTGVALGFRTKVTF
jgi:porin